MGDRSTPPLPEGCNRQWLILRYITGRFTADMCFGAVDRSDGHLALHGRPLRRRWRGRRAICASERSTARTDISRCTVVRSDGDGVGRGRYVLRSGRPLRRTSRAARSSAQTEMAWGAGDMCCGAVDRSDGHLALHGRPLRRTFCAERSRCALERSTAQEHTSYTSRHDFWVRVSK